MWVCSAAYTILLKYAGIAAIHILFMIANISALCVMQLAVSEHVWVDNVKLQKSFQAYSCDDERLSGSTKRWTFKSM